MIKILLFMLLLVTSAYSNDFTVLEFTSNAVFNYFFSVYVYISVPMFIGFAIMGLLRN